jgi:hypothetical protein
MEASMADDPNEARRKEQLQQDQELRAKSYKEFTERTQGVKPTPTQEENDRAALGEHVVEKEPDGSPEETSQAQDARGHVRHTERKVEAGRPGQYQTRAATPPRPQQGG